MTQTLKVIETKYKGYRFRSRLEARWAVYFDTMGVEYEYEPEGFQLGRERYLPDFKLPSIPLWVEVKGAPPTAREQRVAQKLATATGARVLLAFVPPWETGDSRELDGNWLYSPNSYEHLTHAFMTVCWICQQPGVSPYGDPRWASCLCTASLGAMAIRMSDKEMEAEFGAGLASLGAQLRVGAAAYAQSLEPNVVSEQHLLAAVRAKQARFEHGEEG